MIVYLFVLRPEHATGVWRMARFQVLWKLTKTNTHTAFLLAKPTPPNINLSSDRFAMFNKKKRDISQISVDWRNAYDQSDCKGRSNSVFCLWCSHW